MNPTYDVDVGFGVDVDVDVDDDVICTQCLPCDR
jgi:hypothetical protein